MALLAHSLKYRRYQIMQKIKFTDILIHALANYYHVLAFNCNKTLCKNKWEQYFWGDPYIFNYKILSATHFEKAQYSRAVISVSKHYLQHFSLYSSSADDTIYVINISLRYLDLVQNFFAHLLSYRRGTTYLEPSYGREGVESLNLQD
jgi:hypothetical protein